MSAQGKAAGFSVVVAADRNRGIGLKGRLPWKLAGDMRFFRELTTCPDRDAVERRYGLSAGDVKTGAVPLEDLLARLKTLPDLSKPLPDSRNAVLMGRHTWESLPDAFRPLPGRVNGVLSRSGLLGKADGHQVWPSMQEALGKLRSKESLCNIFVIGGAQVFAEALLLSECDRIYLTDIDSEFSCDIFFPEIPPAFREAAASDTIVEDGIRYRFKLLQRYTG